MPPAATARQFRLSQIPGRAAAEDILRGMQREPGAQASAVLLVAEQLLALSDRYGYPEGERLLADYCLCWYNALLPGEMLFRWTYSTFLVAPVFSDEEAAAARFERLNMRPVLCWLETPEGKVLAGIGTRHRAFAIDAGRPVESISHAIDTFACIQVD